MYIVNAPMMFTGIWACIRPWLDEKTRQKIHIKGNAKELLEFVFFLMFSTFIKYIFKRLMPKTCLTS